MEFKELKSKKRNSSFEILRILAMFFIIISHYSVHGGFSTAEISNNFNKNILNFVVLGNLGVNIFALLTGYFGVKSKFKLKKVFLLQNSVLFYSILFYTIFLLTGFVKFNILTFIQFVFPTTFNIYWFFTAYIILYFLTPYINLLLQSVSRGKHLVLIVLLLTLWSLIPLITNQMMYRNGLTDLIMLYIIGAYLRLYPNNLLNERRKYSLLILIITIILPVSAILMGRIFNFAETYFYSRHSVLIISLSVGLILLFANLNVKSNKYINNIASTVFGIYLIHDHPLVREYMWLHLFKNYELANSHLLLFYMIITVMIVFLVASLIEWYRKKKVEPFILTFYESVLKDSEILLKTKTIKSNLTHTSNLKETPKSNL